jgi:hypothetical protein
MRHSSPEQLPLNWKYKWAGGNVIEQRAVKKYRKRIEEIPAFFHIAQKGSLPLEPAAVASLSNEP